MRLTALKKNYVAAVAILVVASIGAFYLVASHAQSPFASAIAASGTISSTANVVSCSSNQRP
jgi:hypothetical protein